MLEISYIFDILKAGETENLPEMQTSFSGKQGILPELSRAIHLESGIVGKYGLRFIIYSAGFRVYFILAAFLYGISFSIMELKKVETDKNDWSEGHNICQLIKLT